MPARSESRVGAAASAVAAVNRAASDTPSAAAIAEIELGLGHTLFVSMWATFVLVIPLASARPS